jgi:hypothetical protein
MRRRTYAKLFGLAIIEIGLLSVLLMPIQTRTVKLDLPAGGSPAVETELDWVPLVSWGAVSIIAISVLAIPVWLAVRIVRRDRATARIPTNFL